MDSYYELVFEDGRRETLDGVTDLAAAKATAKTVASVTKTKVKLNKVQPIDPTAPPVRRGTTSNED